MDLPEGYQWVSCSQEMGVAVAKYRHLVIRGGLDTVCGNSASHPDVWRGSWVKTECSACMKWLAAQD